MTGFRHERQPHAHTAMGHAPDSDRIPLIRAPRGGAETVLLIIYLSPGSGDDTEKPDKNHIFTHDDDTRFPPGCQGISPLFGPVRPPAGNYCAVRKLTVDKRNFIW